MDDLISRQAAIEAFEKELSAKYNRRELAIGFVGIKSILNNLPSVQPERPKGEWVHSNEDDGDYWECSQCKDQFVLEVDVTPKEARMFFCPNCGADMRGEA